MPMARSSPFTATSSSTAASPANGNITADSFTLAGSIGGAGNLTVNSPQIDVSRGTLNFSGHLFGPTSIRISNNSLTPLQSPTTIDVLPATFNGSIDVLSGELDLPYTFGNYTVPVNVGSLASVNVVNGTYSCPINLNNANGINNTGALFSNNTQGFSFTTLNAPVSLGISGSTVSGSFDFKAPVSGGSLTIAAGPSIIESPSPYNGLTTINNASLQLYSNGTIPSTSGIVLDHSTLGIANNKLNLPDRISDSAGIVMNASTVVAWGASTDNGETMGTLTLLSGMNTIQLSPSNTGVTMTLAFAGLVRNPGTTLYLQNGPAMNFSPVVDANQRVRFAGQPLTSFLGGAITELHGLTASEDFVKYDANGVTAFSTSDYSSSNESLWTLSSIPYIASGANLSNSHTIAAIKLTNYSLNLGGNVLNLTSGGIILNTANITGTAGNRLTAGGSGNQGELIFHSGTNYAAGNITANITDNPGPDGLYDPVPGGPLDADNGIVSVTFSGQTVGGGAYNLSGTNTYTGTTFIDGSIVNLLTRSAVPSGPIVINGGTLFLPSASPVTISSIIIDGGARVANAISR